MLKSDSIKAGHAYVNERVGSIREVVEELDRLRVRFNEFDLQTGQLIPAPFQIAYKSHWPGGRSAKRGHSSRPDSTRSWGTNGSRR
jgi:hypothetical protein